MQLTATDYRREVQKLSIVCLKINIKKMLTSIAVVMLCRSAQVCLPPRGSTSQIKIRIISKPRDHACERQSAFIFASTLHPPTSHYASAQHATFFSQLHGLSGRVLRCNESCLPFQQNQQLHVNDQLVINCTTDARHV